MNQNFDYQPPSDRSFFGQQPSAQLSPKKNPYATASLILGIFSVAISCLCCCLYYISVILAVLAIVFACIAKKKNEEKMPPSAVAGLIFAIVGLLIFLIFLGYEILFITTTTD